MTSTPPDPTRPLEPPLDAARARVVRLLTDRYADDTLTVEEFEAELDRMHALTDVAALERMADALVSGVRPAGVRPAAPRAVAPRVAPRVAPSAAATPDAPAAAAGLGWQRGALVLARVPDVGRVFAVMSSSKRRGAWPVPRALRVLAVMSEAVVDLRDAVLPAEGCAVEIAALMANVKVLLPPDVEAAVDMTAFMGAAHDHTRVAPGLGHALRVRVAGTSVMSEVQVLQGVEAELAALEVDD